MWSSLLVSMLAMTGHSTLDKKPHLFKEMAEGEVGGITCVVLSL